MNSTALEENREGVLGSRGRPVAVSAMQRRCRCDLLGAEWFMLLLGLVVICLG